MRVLRVQIGKVLGKFEQVVVKRHASCQSRLIEFGLLGLAPEIEVGKNAPLFQGLHVANDGFGYLVTNFQELITAAGGV
jgi:hypothetical protein